MNSSLDETAILAEHDLRAERDYWRDVAAYLADCHAATAGYDGELSSVSKSRRERFASICDTAAMALMGSFQKRSSARNVDDVVKRCAQAAERLRAK